MVWARTLQPLRCCRHLLKRQLCRAAPRGKVHGKAFFPLGAGGVSFFLSKGHLLLDEEEDEEEEEDFSAHSWNKCQPEPFASGAQVFVWGHHACWPVCEAAEAARAPETGIHAPTEAAWFRQYAEQNNCKWQQLSFGPSFGASRTDTGEIFLWGSTLRKDGKNRQYAPPRPLFLKDETELRFRDVQCSESSVWGLTAAGDVVVWQRVPQMISDHLASHMPRFCVGGRRLGGLKRPVKQMSVGAMHAAFLTEDGRVYCLGRNACGECGFDPAVQNVATSCRRVSFPRHSHPVQRVECGKSHTVAVGAEGQCLSWGDDSKIQLGLGDTRSAVGEERPSSGSRGFLRQRQTGETMSTPSGFRGGPEDKRSRAASTSQRSYKDFESHQQVTPAMMMEIPLEPQRQVHGSPYPPPSDVRCGDDFTLLLVRDSPDWYPPEEESERLFCCGENGKGQCGRSMQQQQQTFAACRLPRNSKILGLSCGSDHCLALLRRVGSRKQELWGWGSNACGQAGGTKHGAVCPAARLRMPKGIRVEGAFCGFASSGVTCSTSTLRAAEENEDS